MIESVDVLEDRDEVRFYCYLCNSDSPAMTCQQLAHHYSQKHSDACIMYNKVKDFVKLSHACDICDESFNTIAAAEEHISQHDNQYTCTHCGIQFRKMLEYAYHVYDHTKEAKCLLCEKLMKGKSSISAHYGVHLKSLRPYACAEPECERRFQELAKLRLHEEQHKSGTKYTCDICERSYTTETYLKGHVRNVHPECRTGKVNNFECTMCDQSFKYNQSLKRHMDKSHGSRVNKYQCEKCARFYSSEVYLKYHLKTVHREVQNENTTCERCSKVFKDTKILRRHMRIMHNTPHEMCEVCGKSFRRTQRKLHQLRHGKKTFACRYCEKMFPIRVALVEHERVHSGEKPYLCQHCGKGFTQAGSRKIHERLHTNERPFSCDLCGKAFTSAGMRNVHQKKCIPKS